MDITLSETQELSVNGQVLRCATGKNGMTEAQDKREGDNKTPRGSYVLRACYYRPDKITPPPHTGLPLVALREDMGWCDDPNHPRYNQLVSLPFSASHEKLWRDDDCYDLIVPIGYNDEPIIEDRGSAIFMHVAKPDYSGTEGCVALSRQDMLATLRHLTPNSYIHLNV